MTVIDLSKYPPDMPMEIIDLQNNIKLKDKSNDIISTSACPSYIEF